MTAEYQVTAVGHDGGRIFEDFRASRGRHVIGARLAMQTRSWYSSRNIAHEAQRVPNAELHEDAIPNATSVNAVLLRIQNRQLTHTRTTTDQLSRLVCTQVYLMRLAIKAWQQHQSEWYYKAKEKCRQVIVDRPSVRVDFGDEIKAEVPQWLPSQNKGCAVRTKRDAKTKAQANMF